MTQNFHPPTYRYQLPSPLHPWKHDRGKTVRKKDGVWIEEAESTWDELAASDVVAQADWPGGEKIDGHRDFYVFLGGRNYTVSDAVATELSDAGYGDRLS